MSPEDQQHILLDLNNPVFQRQLFSLSKHDQRSVLKTLRKLARMTWYQGYTDNGLKWETIPIITEHGKPEMSTGVFRSKYV